MIAGDIVDRGPGIAGLLRVAMAMVKAGTMSVTIGNHDDKVLRALRGRSVKVSVGLEASLAQYRDLEGGLKTTLVSAQKVAEDMRQNAQKEAARLVSEAEGRVELMMQKAQVRVDEASREIDTLRLKRREVQTNIEACVSTLQSTLDFVREQDQRERDHRIVTHRVA